MSLREINKNYTITNLANIIYIGSIQFFNFYIFTFRKQLYALGVLVLLGLVGCGSHPSKNIRLDMDEQIYSLDPQFSTGYYAQMIIANSFEGLMRQEADGTIASGVSENFTISEDGRKYTFYLRKDVRWSRRGDRGEEVDGGPVTAWDFEFAFHRLFDPEIPSPYGRQYLMISGAKEAMDGEIPVEEVGVHAVDDYTLVITLTDPSPFFLQRLTSTSTMPCNKKFFTETRARYGLGNQYLQFNGPFLISTWDMENYIILNGSNLYRGAEELSCPRVIFYTNRLTQKEGNIISPRQLFLNGNADIAQVEYEDLDNLISKGNSYVTFDDKVWVLAFNPKSQIFSNLNIRLAFASVLNREELMVRADQRYTLANSFVAPRAMVFDKSYQELVSSNLIFPEADSVQAGQFLTNGLKELGLDSLPALTLLLPQSAEFGSLGGYYQKLWQQGINQYVNLKILSDDDHDKALATGNWDITILSISVEKENPNGTLAAFISEGAGNRIGLSDPQYDQIISEAQTALQIDQAVELYYQAEQYLLDQAIAIPLYAQASYYAQSPGVSGVNFLPGGGMDFRNAFRK